MERGFDFDVSAWPPLPRLRGLMVVGTDTGVGKTLIAGAIARRLRLDGRRAAVFKPAASGCRHDRNDLISADAEFLAACADTTQSLAQITPVRFAQPLAPNVAAERLGQSVDLDAIFQAYRRLPQYGEVAVVEGIGGLLCPISDDFWVIHFAKLIGLPLVLVARPGLGTINHTLLTLHAARSAGLHIAAVVINRFPGDNAPFDPSIAANPAQIAQRGKVDRIVLVTDEPDNDVEKATIAAAAEATIAQVPWAQIAGL
ncbi:MAG: dethiobiotin synthase [Planctomycetaceae bacterium]|nr:dethiobiotin synthase [Planctomycetaceae bacterium]